MAFLRDRSGRLVPEKIIALLIAVAPVLWLAGRTVMGDLGSKPATEAIHRTGDWTVRLLLITLAISPARRIFRYNRLVLARRILGVSVACYAALHLSLYAFSENFDLLKVASEIVLRIYLTIGFVALVGLIVLAATSTDAAIRKMGARNWDALHGIVYAITVLGLLHFYMQSKLDVTEPVLMSGFFFWLIGYRMLNRLAGQPGPRRLVLLAAAASLLTAGAEALWYGTMTGVKVAAVLEANLDFTYEYRPMWWVLACGLAIAAGAWMRAALPGAKPARPVRSAQLQSAE